jgi:hypothetical protein
LCVGRIDRHTLSARQGGYSTRYGVFSQGKLVYLVSRQQHTLLRGVPDCPIAALLNALHNSTPCGQRLDAMVRKGGGDVCFRVNKAGAELLPCGRTKHFSAEETSVGVTATTKTCVTVLNQPHRFHEVVVVEPGLPDRAHDANAPNITQRSLYSETMSRREYAELLSKYWDPL